MIHGELPTSGSQTVAPRPVLCHVCRVGFAVTVLLTGTALITVLGPGLVSLGSSLGDKARLTACVQPLAGTLFVGLLTGLLAIPVGCGAGIFLEELARKGPIRRYMRSTLTLFGELPPIVYGLVGLVLFVWVARWPVGWGTATLVLAMMTLPSVVLAAQESVRRVPRTLREASLALGATRWQTVVNQVLPTIWRPMLAASIRRLAIAMSDATPVLMLYLAVNPEEADLHQTLLPLAIYDWALQFDPAGSLLAATGMTALCLILICLHQAAIVVEGT